MHIAVMAEPFAQVDQPNQQLDIQKQVILKVPLAVTKNQILYDIK